MRNAPAAANAHSRSSFIRSTGECALTKYYLEPWRQQQKCVNHNHIIFSARCFFDTPSDGLSRDAHAHATMTHTTHNRTRASFEVRNECGFQFARKKSSFFRTKIAVNFAIASIIPVLTLNHNVFWWELLVRLRSDLGNEARLQLRNKNKYFGLNANEKEFPHLSSTSLQNDGDFPSAESIEISIFRCERTFN